MYPKILIDPGRDQPLVELQKSYDTDLKTKEKTVVGAINEINEKLGFASTIKSASDEFIVDENGTLTIGVISKDKVEGLNEDLKELASGKVDIHRLSQNKEDILILNCND